MAGERQPLYLRIDATERQKQLSKNGLIGNLARRGIININTVNADGSLKVDQLAQSSFFHQRPEALSVIANYSLSERSKVRRAVQEAHKKLDNGRMNYYKGSSEPQRPLKEFYQIALRADTSIHTSSEKEEKKYIKDNRVIKIVKSPRTAAIVAGAVGFGLVLGSMWGKAEAWDCNLPENKNLEECKNKNTQTPTPEKTKTVSPTPVKTKTPSPTPEKTSTPFPTPEQTKSPVPTPVHTVSPTPEVTQVKTSTPTPETRIIPSPSSTLTPVVPERFFFPPAPSAIPTVVTVTVTPRGPELTATPSPTPTVEARVSTTPTISPTRRPTMPTQVGAPVSPPPTETPQLVPNIPSKPGAQPPEQRIEKEQPEAPAPTGQSIPQETQETTPRPPEQEYVTPRPIPIAIPKAGVGIPLDQASTATGIELGTSVGLLVGVWEFIRRSSRRNSQKARSS